ncbi:MAG: hypothetical protein IPH76_09425 [Xanthomonadales bacterium]|nr:hypothetical protein [Xanthomonadales bacterium]
MRSRALSGTPQILPHAQPEANDAFDLDFTAPPAPPADTDGDGMPDAFEVQYAGLGLNTSLPQTNGHELSVPLLGVAGYDNLEVYLHLLSEQLATPTVLFASGFESVP